MKMKSKDKPRRQLKKKMAATKDPNRQGRGKRGKLKRLGAGQVHEVFPAHSRR